MHPTRRYAPYVLAATALACVVVGLAVGLPVQAQPELLPGTPAPPATPEALLADIELLNALDAMNVTSEQALKAAELLDALADARDKESATREGLIAQSGDTLLAVRKRLLQGDDLNSGLEDELRALQDALRESRRGVVQALAEAERAISGLITEEQLQALESAREARRAASRSTRPNPLLAVRQLGDQEYAEKRDNLIERLAGKDADDARKAEIGEALDTLRELPDAELEARLPEIRAAIAGHEAEGARAPDAGAGGDPFGALAPPDGERELAGPAAALAAVRRLDDARYAKARERIATEAIRRAGGDPADAELIAKVGALLDKVRALPEGELAAGLPGIAAELGELLPAARRARGPAGATPSASARGVRGALPGLLLGDARRTASVLREYAGARS